MNNKNKTKFDYFSNKIRIFYSNAIIKLLINKKKCNNKKIKIEV